MSQCSLARQFCLSPKELLRREKIRSEAAENGCISNTSFLIKAHPAYAQYFLEQLKSPLFNFFEKLPIIQKIIPEYLAQAYSWARIPLHYINIFST